MLTQLHVLEAVKAGRGTQCLDGRDYSRLVEFFPVSDWSAFGFGLKEGGTPPEAPRPWTEDEVKKQLSCDVSFGFEKALNKRGISASLMNEVVKMWLWILEDPLQYHSNYARYGLPLLKATAVKYGFPNPIGDKSGNEAEYASE